MLSSNPSATSTALRFGRFELNAGDRQLLIDGRPAVLGTRAFDLLVALAERPGALVRKNELLDRVWPGQIVEENNIAVQVNALRKLLGGDLIGTVPGRGYRFMGRVECAAVPPLAMPPPAPALQTHLPRVLPTLLGRAGYLGSLGALVDSHALVNVTGAGGIGKTLLVQHLLDARRRAYRHGVCWVELAGVTDAAALPATLAAALGVRLGGGDALDALALAVGPLELLLALDNAEHLAGDVGRLAARLLEAAPGLKLVVTSQAPLGVAVERVLRLGPLDLPPPGVAGREALASGAVALFVDRAQAAGARFALTEADVAAVLTLCRSLDGLALAIELAAARAPMLGIHGLARSMGDRLQLLTRNRNHSAPARQQTLRATLEWSHGLLDSTEQAVFRRLAVVVGSCSLQMAQQIAADPAGEGPIDPWAVLDALDRLVDRSLVAVLPSDDDSSPRYRLLETPKVFALERLAAAKEVEATRARHAQSVAEQFESAWLEHLEGGRDATPLRRRLEADFDNARTVIGFAAATGDHATLMTVASILQRALPRSSLAEQAALADTCVGIMCADITQAHRRLGWMAASLTWANCSVQRSLSSIQEFLPMARRYAETSGDRRDLYQGLAVLCRTRAQLGDFDGAEMALAELTEIERVQWPPALRSYRANAEMRLGQAQGDRMRALRAGREAHALSTPGSEWFFIHLVNVADAELAAGETHAAIDTGSKVVSMLECGRDEWSLSAARLNLCAALLAAGEVGLARVQAEIGWAQALMFDMQPYWADYFALLSALQARPIVAAKMAGYSQARYAARDEQREANEADALGRACRLACGVLGDTEFERLQAVGSNLRDEDISTLMFGISDA